MRWLESPQCELMFTFVNRAIDEILPVLLEALDHEELAANALHGLRQIMAVKSDVVLPFLVPKLTVEPVTAQNAQSLKALAEVSGEVRRG